VSIRKGNNSWKREESSMGKTLSKEQLEAINAYWRAANYLRIRFPSPRWQRTRII
jgi:hypothetical protein